MPCACQKPGRLLCQSSNLAHRTFIARNLCLYFIGSHTGHICLTRMLIRPVSISSDGPQYSMSSGEKLHHLMVSYYPQKSDVSVWHFAFNTSIYYLSAFSWYLASCLTLYTPFFLSYPYLLYSTAYYSMSRLVKLIFFSNVGTLSLWSPCPNFVHFSLL